MDTAVSGLLTGWLTSHYSLRDGSRGLGTVLMLVSSVGSDSL